jgi:flagellar basal-body rod protein FlgF
MDVQRRIFDGRIFLEKGIYVATSGGMAQERAMEIISNNLANTSTNAFKADRLVFSSYVNKSSQVPPTAPPSPGEIRAGLASLTQNDSIYKIGSQGYTDFSQGSLLATGNPLDVALDGDGFVAVETPDGERYTRGGSLKLAADGTLVTSEGHAVLDASGRQIVVPSRVDLKGNGIDNTIKIMGNGLVNISDGNYARPAGFLKIVDFSDKTRLEKIGAGLYKAPDEVQPEPSGASVRQGFLEGSNINPVAEMTRMITGLRAYESFQKAIQSHDEMDQRLISDVAR